MFERIPHYSSLAFTHPVFAGLLLAPIFLVLWFAFHKGWPKPLPGIPHNENLGFWGDVPSMISHVKRTGGEFWSWHSDQTVKLQSPLVQVFISRFDNRPALLLTDPREAQDILLRRTEEFDRAQVAKDFIRGLIPKGQITLDTNDEWKAHRALTKD